MQNLAIGPEYVHVFKVEWRFTAAERADVLRRRWAVLDCKSINGGSQVFVTDTDIGVSSRGLDTKPLDWPMAVGGGVG